MWFAVATMFVGSLVVLLIGRRAARGSLPRNHLAGVRTTATLVDDDAWRVGNEVAGPYVVLAGASSLLATAGVAAVALAGASEAVVAAALVVVALLLAGTVVVGGVLGDRAARRFRQGSSTD